MASSLSSWLKIGSGLRYSVSIAGSIVKVNLNLVGLSGWVESRMLKLYRCEVDEDMAHEWTAICIYQLVVINKSEGVKGIE